MFCIEKGQFGFTLTFPSFCIRGTTREMSQSGIKYTGCMAGAWSWQVGAGSDQQLKEVLGGRLLRHLPLCGGKGGSPRMRASEGRAREPRDEGDEAGLLWAGEEGLGMRG